MPSNETAAAKKPWATLAVRRSLIVVAFFLLTLGVYYAHLFLWPQEFREGQVIPFTVFAPITFSYTDGEKLDALSGNVFPIARPANLRLVRCQGIEFHGSFHLPQISQKDGDGC